MQATPHLKCLLYLQDGNREYINELNTATLTEETKLHYSEMQFG